MVECLLSTGPTLSSFYLLLDVGLPLHLFLAYRWWELVLLFIQTHHQKFLPHLHVSIDVCRLTDRYKNESDTKWTVVMWCQIVYMESVAPYFTIFLKIVPWIWEKPYIQMFIWYFSNNLDIYHNVGKLGEQHFSVWLFSRPGDKILFLLKFNEARISEWNVCNRRPFTTHVVITPLFVYYTVDRRKIL